MSVLKATQKGQPANAEEESILSKPTNKRTPSRVRIFLDAYAACGSVTEAAKAAGIHRTSHYMRLHKDPEYRKHVEGVENDIGQQIEDACVKRARDGTKRLQLWRGKPIKTKNGHLLYEIEWDTQLQLGMLKRFRPAQYREHIVQEHTGSVNLVERLEAARARLIAMKREEDAAS
jgi:hypothetical protein